MAPLALYMAKVVNSGKCSLALGVNTYIGLWIYYADFNGIHSMVKKPYLSPVSP